MFFTRQQIATDTFAVCNIVYKFRMRRVVAFKKIGRKT